MWGFRKLWAQGQVEEFLTVEDYQSCSITTDAIKSALHSAIADAG